MLPTIRILQPGSDMKRYSYSRTAIEDISVASLKAFVDDFKAGRLQRLLKSQEEPSDQVEVYTIVGKTWHQVVQDASKDVFVFYYAPWCKQCEQMAPTWDALAESVKDQDDIMIAKFNSVENELNEFTVTKQPTIRFHTRENKDGIDFTGDARNMKELQAFMVEHSAAFRAHYDRVHPSSQQPHDEL